MEQVDYRTLYTLQDEVMNVVFDLDNEFYLTGGTALHRFYYHLRYSDDLDFFANNDMRFGENVKEIIEILQEKFMVEKVVYAKDFKRFIINNILQIDFVDDRVYRYGKSEIFGNKRVDNKINILANKICAIIDRDEEKDIFDLICFVKFEEFNWKEILQIANKKAVVEKEVLIYRLKTFPMELLENIRYIKRIEIEKDILEKISQDILYERDNSLKDSYAV